MKYIQKIYIKLLEIFDIKKYFYKNTKTINDICSLEFILTDTDLLDIRCKIPDTTAKSLEDITVLAEKYANLLVGVNGGLFKEDIAKILQKTIDDTDENRLNDHLLANNILYFWALLHIENEKNKDCGKDLFHGLYLSKQMYR